MPVPVIFHSATALHDPGAGHPERPERIAAVLAALRAPDMTSAVDWVEGTPATRDQLERVHSPRYLDALEGIARAGGGELDPDTVMSPRSWDAAAAAAGVAVRAVELGIARGSAFGATRPPGHHALYDRAMGFCLINNRSEEQTSELQSRLHLVCRFFIDTAPTEIYTLSLPDALPTSRGSAFGATRPPGHHALYDRAMGFCLINN